MASQHELRERVELQRRLARWLEGPLTVLALLMLGLVVLQFLVPLSAAWQTRVNQIQTAIWVIFGLDFVVELLLAPSKLRYLRRNWIIAIAVLLPAVRSLRVLRAAQAARSISLVRLLTVVNRGGRALEHLVRRGQVGYVLALTVVITLAGAGGALYFEAGEPGATIQTAGDAVWWAATLITTINSPLAVVTDEGRVIGMLLRIYALGLSGYVTAIIAAQVFGIGNHDDARDVQRELQVLRREIQSLRAPTAHPNGAGVTPAQPDSRRTG